MYAVIFRAQIRALDAEYTAMATRLRELALSEYGCKEFVACTEGSQEIAISYWESEEQIKVWKQNAEHLLAQDKGRASWYRSCKIEVVQIVRAYSAKIE